MNVLTVTTNKLHQIQKLPQKNKEKQSGAYIFNHLKTTRVSKKSPFPIHELVKAPEFINQICTRAKRQVVRISKYNLAADFLQLVISQTFYCTCKKHKGILNTH